MGFVSMPFIPKLSGALSAADSSVSNAVVGGVYFHKTLTNQWSVLRCYVAGASIVQGVGLVRPAAQASVNILVTAATTDVNSYALRGIAAAAVSNTGHISFCYTGGYVPQILFGSAASGTLHGLSGSTAGAFTPFASAGSTIAINTKPFFFPILAHDVTTAGTGCSGTITVNLW